MTIQTQSALQLPAVIQSILDDDTHPHYAYCRGFENQMKAYLATFTTCNWYQEQSQWHKLVGFFDGGTCFLGEDSELHQKIYVFLDSISLFAQQKMTELAPSLDDSVIVVHQETIIYVVKPVALFCYQCDKQCTCALGD